MNLAGASPVPTSDWMKSRVVSTSDLDRNMTGLRTMSRGSSLETASITALR